MSVKPSFFHPAVFLSTWFGTGLLKPAPGTWGTLAALPFAWCIAKYYGQEALIIASILIYFLGVYTSHIYSKLTNSHDASEVVIDEVAGVWLTLGFVPINISSLIIGFLLFRLFDIFKPWPIGPVDKRMPGGWGIMTDDMIAGLFAGILLYGANMMGWLNFVN